MSCLTKGRNEDVLNCTTTHDVVVISTDRQKINKYGAVEVVEVAAGGFSKRSAQ